MNLLVAHASYHCISCLSVVEFEPYENDRGWQRGVLRPDGSAIGACRTHTCEQFGKRFKVVLPTIFAYPLETPGMTEQPPKQ